MKYPSTLILFLPIYKYMGFDKAIRSYLGEKKFGIAQTDLFMVLCQ